MKRKRTLLAILLILAMVLSMPGFSTFVFAEDAVWVQETTDEAESMDVPEGVDEPLLTYVLETVDMPEEEGESEAIDASEVMDKLEILEEAVTADISEAVNTPEIPGEDAEIVEAEAELETISFKAGFPVSPDIDQTDMNNATVIYVGNYTFTLSAVSKTCFSFIPDETDTYVFDVSSDNYTIISGGWLYDANGIMLSDRVWQTSKSIRITHLLESGQTYYYGVYADYDNQTVYINLEQYSITNGWKSIDNEWYYFLENGSYATGIQTIDGKQYYFFPDGRMSHSELVNDTDNWKLYLTADNGEATLIPSGWYEYVDTHDIVSWYYVDNDGCYAHDEVRVINEKQYYFGLEGRMAHDTAINYNGKNYLADSSGVLTEAEEGWCQSGSNWVYIKDGSLYQGWLDDGGYTYYLDPVMVADNYWTDRYTNKYYYFDEMGHLQNNGWGTYEVYGETHLYYAGSDGALLTGWQEINGKMYYFASPVGYMYTSLREIEGAWYYFDSSGAMQTGWIKRSYEGPYKWIYADESGVLQTGWQKVNDTWYYLDPNGLYMYEDGTQEIEGKKYFFSDSGALIEKAGWQSIISNKNNKKYWYYLDSEGTPVTGWKKIDGSWYYFGPYDGSMYGYGCWVISGKLYGFSSSGALLEKEGWMLVNGYYDGSYYENWYYIYSDGRAATGWKKINGNWYYFTEDSGIMITGDFRINGKDYYFDSNGVMQTGWVKRIGQRDGYPYWYYYNSGGDMATGWKQIDGKWYFFSIDVSFPGIMKTGWHHINGKWYYFEGSGAMTTGWKQLSGKWYYLDSSGAMLANTSRKIGSKTYNFNSSGVCTNP